MTELTSDELKTRIRTAEVSTPVEEHIDKPLYGVFYEHLERHGLSKKLTSETEGFIMACQKITYNTLVYRNNGVGSTG